MHNKKLSVGSKTPEGTEDPKSSPKNRRSIDYARKAPHRPRQWGGAELPRRAQLSMLPPAKLRRSLKQRWSLQGERPPRAREKQQRAWGLSIIFAIKPQRRRPV